jgi:hypothetical protein
MPKHGLKETGKDTMSNTRRPEETCRKCGATAGEYCKHSTGKKKVEEDE